MRALTTTRVVGAAVALTLVPITRPADAGPPTTWIVDDDAPGDPGPGDKSIGDPLEDGTNAHPFDSIQEAINVCSNGDIIEVEPGTYFESIANKFCTNIETCGPGSGNLSITVRSTGGPDVTTIDATGTGTAAVHFTSFNLPTAPQCEIEGFTVQNALGGAGHGMRLVNTESVVRNCVITGNSATSRSGGQGGGILCGDNFDQTTLLVEDCVISGNSSEQVGDGISIVGVVSATLRNCQITGNDDFGLDPWGVFVQNCDTVLMVDTVIAGNGAGMWINNGTSIDLVNCRISDHRLPDSIGPSDCPLGCGRPGNGVLISDGVAANMVNCVVSGNRGYRRSGVFIDTESTVTMTNCTVAGNESFGIPPYSHEGAVEIANQPAVGMSTLTMANCIVYGNLPEGTALGSQFPGAHTTLTLTYSNIEAGSLHDNDIQGGWPGTGNIDADPRFTDPDGADDIPYNADDDYHIFVTSPCIDAGDNAALPADVGDVDGDANTAETIPYDYDGLDRLTDDPNTPDTGNGTAPLVDMGAYEFTPTAAAAQGPSLWIDPAGGAFDDDANWSPDAPLAQGDTGVFGLGPGGGVAGALAYTVDMSDQRPILSDQLRFIDDDVLIDLGGGTVDMSDQLVDIGAYGDALPSVNVINGTWQVDSVTVRGAGAGVLNIAPGAFIGPGGGIQVRAGGTLSGGGSVMGNVVATGFVDPVGTMVVVGDYTQLSDQNPDELSDQAPILSDQMSDQNGGLCITITDVELGQSDVLQVDGAVALGGTLLLESTDMDPALGIPFDIVETTGGITGGFDTVITPDLSDQQGAPFFSWGFGGGFAGVAGAATSVSITAFSLEALIGFGDPSSTSLSDAAQDVVVADFDGVDGDDVAVILPGATPQTNGTVVLLKNAGVSGMGAWLGFQSPVQLNVGPDPVGIAAANLDGNAGPDIAVANRDNGTVSMLANNGDGTFASAISFSVAAEVDEVSSIAAADLNGNATADIVVAGTSAQETGRAVVALDAFTALAGVSLTGYDVGFSPVAVAPADLDGDSHADLAVANFASSDVTVLVNGGAGSFGAGTSYKVGAGPVDLTVADLDGSGTPDIATVNLVSGSVSILKNSSTLAGTVGFAAATTLLIGDDATDIVAVDMDDDGDTDIAVIAQNALSAPVGKLIRNDTTSAGALTLVQPEQLDLGPGPGLLVDADLNGDSGRDLVSPGGLVGGVAGGLSPGVEVRLNQSSELTPSCIGDADGNGAVDVDDLVAVILDWGTDGANNNGDVDGSGLTDVDDLVTVILNWGPCP